MRDNLLEMELLSQNYTPLTLFDSAKFSSIKVFPDYNPPSMADIYDHFWNCMLYVYKW